MKPQKPLILSMLPILLLILCIASFGDILNQADGQHRNAPRLLTPSQTANEASDYLYVGGIVHVGYNHSYIAPFRATSGHLVSIVPPTRTVVYTNPYIMTHDASGKDIYAPIGNDIEDFRISRKNTLNADDKAPFLAPGAADGKSTIGLTTINSFAWSPNGNYLYALIGDPNLFMEKTNGQVAVYRHEPSGKLVPLPKERLMHIQAPVSMAFMPNGKYAYMLYGGSGHFGNPGYLQLYRVGQNGALLPVKSKAAKQMLTNYYENSDTVLVSPNGRRAYVSSTAGLDEYDVAPDGGLTHIFNLPDPISYPVLARNGSIIYALRRMPGASKQPGASSLLMAIHVDPKGVMTATQYLMHGDGSLLQGGSAPKIGPAWGKLGYAIDLSPSSDGHWLYLINPSWNEGLFCYHVDSTGVGLTLSQKVALPDDPKTSAYPASLTVISGKK